MSDSIFGLDACRRAINALPAGSHASISHARNSSSRIQRVAMVSKKSVNRADWGHICRLYLLVSRAFRSMRESATFTRSVALIYCRSRQRRSSKQVGLNVGRWEPDRAVPGQENSTAKKGNRTFEPVLTVR